MIFRHCVFLLAFLPLFAKAQVYDCFLFCNELEILDIRLHEMAEHVDKFVLVESTETFRGNPKPLYYRENAARFEPFKEKIIHVIVDGHFPAENPWDRETFQRNQIMRGLTQCTDEDVILVSDVDEIVKKEDIPQIVQELGKDHPFVGVSHRYHSNYLNSVPSATPWKGTVVARYRDLQQISPQLLRNQREQVPSVARGWHFTWQGGLGSDLYKIKAFSHSEMDNPKGRKRARENAKLRPICPIIEIDDSFPDYIRQNQKHFERIDFIRNPTVQHTNWIWISLFSILIVSSLIIFFALRQKALRRGSRVGCGGTSARGDASK